MDSKIIEEVRQAAFKANLEAEYEEGKFTFRYQTLNYAIDSKIVYEFTVECGNMSELRKGVANVYSHFDPNKEADKYLLEDDPDYDYMVQYMEDAEKAVCSLFQGISQL